MRKFTLILFSLFITVLFSSAQTTMGNLWGVFPQDQLMNYNTYTAYDSNIYNFQANSTFLNPPENPIYGGLVQAADGNFYGVTAGGGNAGAGAIFKCSPTGVVTTLYLFQGASATDGYLPYGGLIIGRDGNFYGMTYTGGANGMGTIFEWNTTTAIETAVYAFGTNTNDGANPDGGLIQAKNGNFYGMTSGGGANGSGIIFEWNPTTATETVLYSFGTNINDGAGPKGSLIQAKNGNLYGVTNSGGANGSGALFKWDTLIAAETVLYSFGAITNDGANPEGTLLQATDNNFYGVTNGGGKYSNGAIFEFNTTSLTEDMLYSFVGGTDGQNPIDEKLVQAADGNLYGTTNMGGTNNAGTVFKWNMSSAAETVLYNLGVTTIPVTVQNPQGSLIQGIDGNLYGMTTYGGAVDANSGAPSCGSIFKCSTLGAGKIFSYFDANSVGFRNIAKVIQAKDGNFYGMTASGGFNLEGVIYKCTPDGIVTNVYTFSGGSTDGQNPMGNLLQGRDGNFYGLTFEGGANNSGTIFKWNPTTATETVLYSFAGGSDGQGPQGSLIQATNGNFYGMTFNGGGAPDAGTIFEWNPTTATETVLYSFTGTTDGGNPTGSLLQASDGNLYGLNSGTGYNLSGTTVIAGAIFQWNMTSQTFNLIKFFQSYPANGDAYSPMGSLIQTKNGLLYGLAQSGGVHSSGAIFSYNIPAVTESVVYSFGATPTDGTSPQGDLLQASDGNLYGITNSGGAFNSGIIFKYDTLAQALDTLQSFSGNSGQNSGTSGLIEAFSNKVTTSCTSTKLLESTVKGAKGAFTYLWSTGASTSSITATTPGTYSVTVTDSRGFKVTDTIVYSTATKLISVATTSNTSICNGSSASLYALGDGGTNTIKYSWLPGPLSGAVPSVSPTTTTTYVVTAIDVNGCTATNKEVVTVNYATTSTLTPTACELYKLNGIDYTATGVYTQHLTSKLGCDSTLTLNLIVNQPSSSSITKSTCNNFVLNGASYNSSGTYTQIIPNKAGCDSNITLHLTITGSVTSNITKASCEGYTLNGTTYTATGIYIQNLTSKTGCDSTLTLNLTVSNNTSSNLIQATCNSSYTLNGSTYNATGTYSQNLTNKAGCDSIITLNLTVNPLPTISITGNSVVNIASSDTLKASGGINYVWTSGSTNDTTIVRPLSNVTYTVTGTDGNGCRDTASFKVTVGPTGVSSISNSGSTTLYPNPAINAINLSFEMQGTGKAALIKIIDATGREIMTTSTIISNGKVLSIDVSSLSQGLYFVKVITNENIQIEKFIKQ